MNHMGLSHPLLIFLLLCSPGDERLLLLFPKGIHNVEGIAVDWMGNNLYWTDDGPKKTISVARLEKAAQTRKTLIEGKMTHPRAIVVDPLNGYGCLGGQRWLVGGHSRSCPQQGPAELAVGSPAPHGIRGGSQAVTLGSGSSDGDGSGCAARQLQPGLGSTGVGGRAIGLSHWAAAWL